MGEHGKGTVRRKSNGSFQGFLPRALSVPPENCESPDNYQQPVLPLFKDKEEARRHLDFVIPLLGKGSALEGDGVITVKILFDGYMRHLRKMKLAKYGGNVDARLKGERSFAKVHGPMAMFWDLPFHLVTAESIRSYIRQLQYEETNKYEEPLSSSFVRSCVGKLHAAFDFGDVVPNPCFGQKLPPKKRPVITFLSTRQQALLFRDEKIPLRQRVMIGCLMSAGLRIGEFLSIKRIDVDVEGSDPSLLLTSGGHSGPLKGRAKGETREVQLTEPALSFWRIWLEQFYEETDSGRVFTGPQDGYMKHWPMELITIGDMLGIKLHPHLLRHTYAMCVLNNDWGGPDLGVNLLGYVQHQLGHESPEVTLRHYGKILSVKKEAALLRGRPQEEKPATTAEDLLKNRAKTPCPQRVLGLVDKLG